IDINGASDEFDTAHFRHALICEEKADRFAAPLETMKGVECGGAGIRPQHTVMLCVMLAQVAIHCPQDFGIIVNGQQHRFGHGRSLSFSSLDWQAATLHFPTVACTGGAGVTRPPAGENLGTPMTTLSCKS